MIKTLREISTPVSPSLYPADKAPSSQSHTSERPLGAPEVQLQQATDPLSSIPPLTENPDLSPSSRAESRASTNWSEEPSSPALSRRGESENGVETEEDDGMVLVGRPKP